MVGGGGGHSSAFVSLHMNGILLPFLSVGVGQPWQEHLSRVSNVSKCESISSMKNKKGMINTNTFLITESSLDKVQFYFLNFPPRRNYFSMKCLLERVGSKPQQSQVTGSRAETHWHLCCQQH